MSLLGTTPADRGTGPDPSPQEPPGRGLASRAVLAVGLVVAFPLLVLALVAAIVAGNVAVAVVARPTAVVVVPSVIAVVALLGTLRPLVRPQRAAGGGLEVSPAEEPALWAVVRDVAAEVGTAPPDVVVLAPGAEASVRDETWLLGLVRRRRVLTLGLALLSLVDVEQLRAVLAHEHAHYAAGDTRLSALSYRSREAVDRAARDLGPGLLGRLFRAYRDRHVRLTESEARAQELAADAASRRVAGAATSAEMLRRSSVAHALFDAFLDQHVEQVLVAGRRPADLYGGFREYCAAPAVRAGAAEHLAWLLEDEGDPLDSHPPLGARLAALGLTPTDPEGLPVLTAEVPAAALLTGRQAVEALLLPVEAEPLAWADVPSEVTAPRLEARAARIWSALPEASAGGLATALALLVTPGRETVARDLVPHLDRLPEEERQRVLDDVSAAGAAALVAAALLAAGWTCAPVAWGATRALLVPPGRDGQALDVDAELDPHLDAADPDALPAWAAGLGADLVWRPVTPAVAVPAAVRSVPLAVLPGLERRGRLVDLVLYDGELVLVPVPARDQAGALLAVYGDIAGRVRRAAARRAGDLLHLPADEAAALRRRTVRLSADGLEARFDRRMLGEWRLRLSHPGGRLVLHDRRPLVAPDSARAVLQEALPRLVARA